MSAGRAVGLLLGVAADAAFGDPRRGHPVAAFGRAAQAVERVLYRDNRVAGVAHTALLVGTAVGGGAVVQRFARRRVVTEAAMTAVTTWAVLGGSSLAHEGAVMAGLLEAGDVDSARDRLGHLCGRDPRSLDAPGLARATVESVAENTSDAVVAPLLCGALGGVPGLLGYRAANTLDAMVGNRSPRYRQFGWASARLDDLLNLVPSRAGALLTVLVAPAVGGSVRDTWRIRRRDADAHPSPNAGQVEAAFAGALRIRLGGRIVYGQLTEQRPVLGDERAAGNRDVARAVALSRLVTAASAALSATVATVRSRR